MAIKYVISQFPTAFPTKCLASKYAAHILNIELTEDAWNGKMIAKGDYKSLDLYSEGLVAPTEFKGKVLEKAPNGQWYVEVEDATDVYMVYNTPLIEEEYSNTFKKETNFFVPAGEVARAYTLCKNDVIALSEDNFDGTPTKGAAITGVSGGKLTV